MAKKFKTKRLRTLKKPESRKPNMLRLGIIFAVGALTLLFLVMWSLTGTGLRPFTKAQTVPTFPPSKYPKYMQLTPYHGPKVADVFTIMVGKTGNAAAGGRVKSYVGENQRLKYLDTGQEIPFPFTNNSDDIPLDGRKKRFVVDVKEYTDDIDCGEVCTAKFDLFDVVHLRAFPPKGGIFEGFSWGGSTNCYTNVFGREVCDAGFRVSAANYPQYINAVFTCPEGTVLQGDECKPGKDERQFLSKEDIEKLDFICYWDDVARYRHGPSVRIRQEIMEIKELERITCEGQLPKDKLFRSAMIETDDDRTPTEISNRQSAGNHSGTCLIKNDSYIICPKLNVGRTARGQLSTIRNIYLNVVPSLDSKLNATRVIGVLGQVRVMRDTSLPPDYYYDQPGNHTPTPRQGGGSGTGSGSTNTYPTVPTSPNPGTGNTGSGSGTGGTTGGTGGYYPSYPTAAPTKTKETMPINWTDPGSFGSNDKSFFYRILQWWWGGKSTNWNESK